MNSRQISLKKRVPFVAVAALAMAAAWVPSQSADAARLAGQDEDFVNLVLFMQNGLYADFNADRDEAFQSWFNHDVLRIALNGKLHPKVGFLFATGGGTGGMAVADAVAMLQFDRQLNIDAGFIVVPWLRHSNQFAGNRNTLRPMGATVRHPLQSTMFGIRDSGVRARGLLVNDMIDYRVAITDGSALAANSLPRVTGRVGVNLMDPEPGYTLPGTYYGQQRVLSLGAAFDMQTELVNGEDLYFAAGADAFVSLPMGPNRLTARTEFAYYGGQNRPGRPGNPDADPPVSGVPTAVLDKSVMAFIFDASYMLGNVGPVVNVAWAQREDDDDFDKQMLNAHLGVNWWIAGPRLALKADVGIEKGHGVEFGDAPIVMGLQLQTMLR